MKHAGIHSLGDCLIQKTPAGDHAHVPKNKLGLLRLGTRPQQRQRRRALDRTSAINRVRQALRLFQVWKHTRQGDLSPAVDNETQHAIVVVSHQKDDRLREVRVQQVSARDQQLACSKIFAADSR